MPDPANDPNRPVYLQIVESQSLIGGRFKNLQRIDADGGGGNFSLVFTADDTVGGNSVVVKVFHPDERSDAYRLACFHREAEILASLRGEPDIIRSITALEEFVETVKTQVAGLQFTITFSYYAAERANGNLDGLIANKQLQCEEALASFRRMCRGVQRAHRRGISHRDIKPSNFLTMNGGGVRLSDFGTARDFRGSGGAVLRTYDRWPGDTRYTSPEMLAGLHDIDPTVAFAGDFFALGCSLFEMLSGVVLSTQLFDPGFVAQVRQFMFVPSSDRKRVFHGVVGAIADRYRFPKLEQVGAAVPGSVRHRLDELYSGMSAIDYRSRQTDFDSVFRQLDICLLILRNQDKYDRWRAERRRRREVAAASMALARGVK